MRLFNLVKDLFRKDFPEYSPVRFILIVCLITLVIQIVIQYFVNISSGENSFGSYFTNGHILFWTLMTIVSFIIRVLGVIKTRKDKEHDNTFDF